MSGCRLCQEDVDQQAVLAALAQNHNGDRFNWVQAKRDLADHLDLEETLTVSLLKKHTESHAAVRRTVNQMEREQEQEDQDD